MKITANFKVVFLTALCIFSAASILIMSNEARLGVARGIELCETAVVPSLFLFTAIALIFSYIGGCKLLGRIVSPFTRPLLGLDGVCTSVFFMSLISGYPVGTKLLCSEYRKGSISRIKALKMLTFSVNAGPSFIVTAVGQGVLGSSADGWRLYIAHILASLILATVVRLLPNVWLDPSRKHALHLSNTAKQPNNHITAPAVSDAFVSAVNDAAKTMLTVSAFVVFFSGVGGIVSNLPLGVYFREVIEVTVGVQACTRSQLSKVAFLLGFGGVSVIFQVMSAAKELKPMLWLVVVSRLFHGTLSAGLIFIFEVISPRTLSTGAFTIGKNAALHSNPIASASLLLLCVVLICFTKTSLTKTARTQTSL